MAHVTLPPAPRLCSQLCRRSGKRVYVADKPVRMGGMVFLPNYFTCKFNPLPV